MTSPLNLPAVSVLMPSYAQSAFIERALSSLVAQTFGAWEAVIVDAGPDDATARLLARWRHDPRIRVLHLPEQGLGAALNRALAEARAPLIAYLPSDDVFHADHLASLVDTLVAHPDAVLAHSGVRHHYNREAPAAIDGLPLQLVQCLHRRTAVRWTERDELESDDLERLFWSRLRREGRFVGTGRVTCEWVDHPAQRHKLMQEPVGGLATFRRHYRVAAPLRFHSSVGHRIDEVAQYRAQRERPDTAPAPDALKILLVGELAYNADRVLALEEAGHRLYGLWMDDPYWYNSIGPLPFGHVQDLPRDDWPHAVQQLQPDVVYALLNWQAVPFACQVMRACPGIPFVWHFKEGPFICLEKGTWPQLVELQRGCDGALFSSPEMRDWFDTVVPGVNAAKPTHVLDGDLPKRDWFTAERSPRRAACDGEVHTVVPGRPIGLHPEEVAALAQRRIHLHFYGDFTQGQWKGWIERTRTLAPHHLHLHANVDQRRWVAEFSQYDAGWLHAFESHNGGDLRRANWDDLNYPARMATLAAAGLPMIQRRNDGHTVAAQALCDRLGTGLFYRDLDGLAAALHDGAALQALRQRVWQQREHFCFDHHVPALLDFFRRVIAARATPGRRALA